MVGCNTHRSEFTSSWNGSGLLILCIGPIFCNKRTQGQKVIFQQVYYKSRYVCENVEKQSSLEELEENVESGGTVKQGLDDLVG